MSKPIIEVEHLSKCYRIGAMREPYLSLREELAKKTRRISSAFSRAFRNGQTGSSGSETDFWALNDVSFSVQEGEAVGIIGRNGAGKSTLLKILSQITPPTKGRIIMRGRVASLLEVGTGFHPELTGRENIYLNGAILGMTRAEIRKKFDEIVAFSEVEKFLETPVKRYSSGMYVRLAFAVAAHLEPEILVVDEVLAVGDGQFQKKCLGKMEEVTKQGRTVLFVSHNMNAMRALCTQGIVLNSGSAEYEGNTKDAVDYYCNSILDTVPRGIRRFAMDGPVPLVITEMRTKDDFGKVTSVFSRSIPVTIQIRGQVSDSTKPLIVAIDFRNRDGLLLFRTHSFEQDVAYRILETNGDFVLQCTLPCNFLTAGKYSVGLVTAIVKGNQLQFEPEALEIEIVQDELYGEHFTRTAGLVTPTCKWQRL